MGKKRIVKKELTGELSEVKVLSPSAKIKLKEGRIYIYSSYNNTIINLTDEKGNTIFSMSAGRVGFKGTKKSTPFAASKVADAVAQASKDLGVERVAVFIKGIGSGRSSALRSLGAKGLEIVSIKDITPIPHNGPRPRKVRRV